MKKNICKILMVGALALSFSTALAVTKPGLDANVDALSYVFYLYYDKGQLFADRDYEIKYDVLNQPFVQENVNEAFVYKGEIFNFKSEVAKTFLFDPRKGDLNFTTGKIMINGPYVPDGLKVNFYNTQNRLLVTIFVSTASICDDNGTCNSAVGENEKTCPNDCKKPRTTPTPVVSEEPSSLGLGFDLNSVLIYVIGTVGVVFFAWLGWKWWKKRREGAFMPPSSPPPPPSLPGNFNQNLP